MDIVKRLRMASKLFRPEEHEAADEIEQLRKSLARCLEEAEGWLDDARGCKPADVIDYDGWADEARMLLRHNGEVRGASRLAGEASSAEGATSTVVLGHKESK